MSHLENMMNLAIYILNVQYYGYIISD